MVPCRVPYWMNLNAFSCMLWALAALLGTQSLARAQNIQKAGRTAQPPQVEEIYIARSVRESRVAPTEYCAQAKTGFNSDSFEDQYTFRSTATRASDGRMVDTNIKTIGSGHGCFGRTADPAILNFYLDLHLGNTALRGIGDCRQAKADFPERGLIAWHRFLNLNLSDSLGRYVGGQLTTNTITSLKGVGLETDPLGYTQQSIATIRLWKKRSER
jgi:hypothetical protein